MELLKADKKVAREVIEKALQKDLAESLEKTDVLIQKWKNEILNNKETYYALFDHVNMFDKYIARRYDNQRGSTYLTTIIGLFMDKIIDERDLVDFSIDVQEYIKKLTNHLTKTD